jgi:hypothetical protein
MAAGWIHYVLNLALAALAWAWARRDPSHRVFAWLVAWYAGGDLARIGLAALREDAPRPYRGFARLVFHLDQALFLSWSFLFVAVAAHYFLRSRPWIVLGAWIATFAICLDYPTVSREVLIALYRTVGLGCVVATWGCIGWAIAKRAEIQPRLAHLMLILYGVVDVVTNLVPMARDYLGNWEVTRFANFMLLGAGVALHAGALARGKSPARTPA